MIGVGTTSRTAPSTWSRTSPAAWTARRRSCAARWSTGPTSADLFTDGLGEFFDEGRACPPDGVDAYAAFTGHGSRYVDDVRSWQTVEPAIDFTRSPLLAFALLQ